MRLFSLFLFFFLSLNLYAYNFTVGSGNWAGGSPTSFTLQPGNYHFSGNGSFSNTERLETMDFVWLSLSPTGYLGHTGSYWAPILGSSGSSSFDIFLPVATLVQAGHCWGSGITSGSYTIIVTPLPPVWSSNPITANFDPGGVPYSINLNDVCTGATSYSSSNLPSWLSISGSTLSGTVPNSTATYNFSVSAINSVGSTSVNFIFNVTAGGAAPVWLSNPITANYNPGGVPYSLDLSSVCTGATSYGSSNLPSWLSISGSTLSGTVPNSTATYNFSVSATNDFGVSNTNFTITVTSGGQLPQKIVTLVFDAYKNSNFLVDLASCFSYATSYSISPAGKPSWLSLSGTSISGSCPVSETAQNYIFDVTATNSVGSVTYPCCVNIRDIVQPDALRITSPSAVRTGRNFSYTPTTNKSGAVITVTGLPAGLAYNNGIITGQVPTGVSTFVFTVHASKVEYADTSLVVYGKYDPALDINPPPPGQQTDDPGLADHVIVDNPNDIKTDVSRLESGLAQSNTTLSRIAATNDGVKSALDGLTQAINDLKTANNTNNTTLTNINNNISNVITNTTTTNNKLADIKADLSHLVDNQHEQQNTLDGINTNTNNTNNKLTEIKDILSNNNNLSDIKLGITHILDNQHEQLEGINDITDMLSSGLDEDVDPYDGYTKELKQVGASDYAVLSSFSSALSAKGKTPPPVKIPLSVLNSNLPSFVNPNFTDYVVDFTQPPISTLFEYIRLTELIIVSIAVLILAFKAVRTFEF